MNNLTEMIPLLIPVIILAIIVDAFCLLNLYKMKSEHLRFNKKWIWALIIIIQFPLGPIIYTIFKENK